MIQKKNGADVLPLFPSAEPSEANLKRLGDDFEWFWSEYPKKKKKGDAFKAWQQTSDIRPPIEEIIAAINEQSKSNQWQKDGGEYIPLPATWLRAWQWEDE